ncbi:hypothetical protein CUJ88_21050 [Paraburkholderia hospita]|nr:hypothetical protein CUJ88_21050 [Paraburkholderia hospita]
MVGRFETNALSLLTLLCSGLLYKLLGIDRLAVVEVELDHVGAAVKNAEALMYRASRQMG